MNAQIFQKTQGEKYGNYDSDDDVPPGPQAEKAGGSSSSEIAVVAVPVKIENPDLEDDEEMPARHRPTFAWKRSANEVRLSQRGAPVGEPVGMSVSGTGAVSVSDSPALPTGDPGVKQELLDEYFP